MNSRFASLVAVCALMAAVEGRATAGGIHIRYGPHAPEKLAAKDVAYYNGVLNLYHNHPAAFAAEHPFYVKMFNNPVMLNRLVARWEAHAPRFEYWHDCLWKVLNGYVHSHQGFSSPAGGSSGVLQLNPAGSGGGAAHGNSIPFLTGSGGNGNGDGGGGKGTSGGGNGGGGGGGIGAQGVPEPSSVLLMGLGVLLAGTCFANRRR